MTQPPSKKLFQNNPFAKFAAGNSIKRSLEEYANQNSGVWLSTKKRGRDDAQIQKDQQTALSFRRQFQQQQQKKKKNNNNNNKKKKRHNNDSDDDDSDDDYSIELGSEEEESEEEEEEESDTIIKEETRSSRRRRKSSLKVVQEKSKKKRVEEESSEEEEDDFMAEESLSSSHQAAILPPSSSSDDDDEFADLIHANWTKSNKMILEDDSSVEEEEENHHHPDNIHPLTYTDDEEDEEDILPQRQRQRQYHRRPQPDSFLVDTDSENENDDMEEAVALSLALKESHDSYHSQQKQKQSQKSKKRTKLQKKKPPKQKQRYIYLDDDDDDNDKDSVVEVVEEEEEEEEYVTKESKEASKVLEAATKLSEDIRRIIKTSWPVDDTKDIALDGALSVSSLLVLEEDEKKDNDGGHWITQEEMRSVCPHIHLKEYQLIGVNWMALLHRMTFENLKKNNNNRKQSQTNVNGVLADGMGLGKTVQTIAFLAWLKYQQVAQQQQQVKETPPKPHLIIVPASVLSNWEREFRNFCPDMNVVKYHGTMDQRQQLKQDLLPFLGSKTDKSLDVVLTTYSYFSSEKSDDRSFLRKFQWNYMVVDEAHCLKNPNGLRYRNMDNFETERRLLLTGTPVQNSPKELMSLLCFLMPLFSQETKSSSLEEDESRNGGNHMLEYFVRLESSSSSHHHREENAYAKLKQLFSPFVLRRTKNSVLYQMMPPKTRRVEWVSFDDSTKAIYDSIVSAHIEGKQTSTMNAKKHLFTVLRKAANHPLLLRNRHTSTNEIDHLANLLFNNGYFGTHESCTLKLVKKELEQFSDYDIHCAALSLMEENAALSQELSNYTLQEQDIFSSPKCVQLKMLLPSLIQDGHRMLIFSQWTRCLDLLGCLMETMHLKFLRLDGSTSVSERQSLIDKFNEDTSIPVFLLSTRAGGMGINLTAADTCILHDLDFNPFNDLQAEDRCHRIGQTKPVTIIKLVAKDTVETDIYRMQERKALMNDAILGASTKSEEKEEINEIMELAMKRYNASK